MPSSSTTPQIATTQPNPETLESDLLAHLASTTALDDLHAVLLCSLQRTGWTERIRKLSQELLRAGRCERFDEVVEAVVASAEGRKHPVLREHHAAAAKENGGENGSGGGGDGFENVDVRIPEAVVQQGVRAIKEVLREVVVMEDDGDGDDHHHAPSSSSGHHATGKSEKIKKESKNGESSPVKKTEKKPKTGKQVK